MRIFTWISATALFGRHHIMATLSFFSTSLFVISNKAVVGAQQHGENVNECIPKTREMHWVLGVGRKNSTGAIGRYFVLSTDTLTATCDCGNKLEVAPATVNGNIQHAAELYLDTNPGSMSLTTKNGTKQELVWSSIRGTGYRQIVECRIAIGMECVREDNNVCVPTQKATGRCDFNVSGDWLFPYTYEDHIDFGYSDGSSWLQENPNPNDPNRIFLAEIRPVLGTLEAGVCGDPHFTSWDGTKFDFHGECDLVLATSPSFGNGEGLDVHIRTTMVVPNRSGAHPYSFISEVAMRIGKEILAVDRGGYWLNGIRYQHEDGDAIHTLSSQYMVRVSDSATKKGRFMKKILVDLGDGHSVKIKAAKSHIDISLNMDGLFDKDGHHNMDDLIGLLGRYHDRALVDRNGNPTNVNNANNANDYGQMWQVREWEDMLFPKAIGPQHPTKCNLPPPSIVSQTSRNLRSSMQGTKALQLAEGACEYVLHNIDRENCIFDVLATGDSTMADFYDDF